MSFVLQEVGVGAWEGVGSKGLGGKSWGLAWIRTLGALGYWSWSLLPISRRISEQRMALHSQTDSMVLTDLFSVWPTSPWVAFLWLCVTWQSQIRKLGPLGSPAPAAPPACEGSGSLFSPWSASVREWPPCLWVHTSSETSKTSLAAHTRGSAAHSCHWRHWNSVHSCLWRYRDGNPLRAPLHQSLSSERAFHFASLFVSSNSAEVWFPHQATWGCSPPQGPCCLHHRPPPPSHPLGLPPLPSGYAIGLVAFSCLWASFSFASSCSWVGYLHWERR